MVFSQAFSHLTGPCVKVNYEGNRFLLLVPGQVRYIWVCGLLPSIHSLTPPWLALAKGHYEVNNFLLLVPEQVRQLWESGLYPCIHSTTPLLGSCQGSLCRYHIFTASAYASEVIMGEWFASKCSLTYSLAWLVTKFTMKVTVFLQLVPR